MLPQYADKMLMDYKVYLGRCSFLAEAIEKLKSLLAQEEIQARNDLILAGPKPQDGMPRGSTTGNPTERVAMMLVAGVGSAEITEIKKQIAEMESEYSEKRMTVVFVEAWLKGLTEKERWMIEQVYFEGATYRELNVRYRDAYKEACSKDFLKRLKKMALEKIYAMAA